MKPHPYALAILIFAGTTGYSFAASPETERFGRFGDLSLYRETPHPAHVVLFVSGDGGWNLGVADMARALASLDALVVGIDIRTYLQALGASGDQCLYPTWDFVTLAKYIQKKLGYPTYHSPFLVGYSSGSTLVYALLAQASSNTFQGGISLGFCPDLDAARPFCGNNGLTSKANPKATGILFDPINEIANPWITLQGAIDQTCDATTAQQYVSQVKGAEIVMLPKVGHGFSAQNNWMPQFHTAFQHLTSLGASVKNRGEVTTYETPVTTAGLPDITDLPVVEVPAGKEQGDTMAFIASGDGGWASLDKQVAGVLAAEGIPVAGLDTLQYYWQPHPADESAQALERILRYYVSKWEKKRILLIGYSYGADVLPFMASRLPEDLKAQVDMITLIGLGKETAFEFHVADWLGTRNPDAVAVQPEVEKLKGQKVLCIYGAEETDSICPLLPAGLVLLDKRAGGHHLGGDYQSIADRIVAESRR